MFYRIRIDLSDGFNIDEFITFVSHVKSYVIVRHELPHGNPHIHMYLECEMKEPAIRQRLRRKFPNIKSSDYSIKKCDESRIDEYVQYMFNTKHGNKWELIDTLNFDDKRIAIAIENAKAISDDYAKSKKSTGPTIWDLALEVEDEFKKTHKPYGNNWSDNERIDVTLYTSIAIKILRKNRKPFDEFLLRKVITTAMSSTEKGTKVLTDKMLKNFGVI